VKLDRERETIAAGMAYLRVVTTERRLDHTRKIEYRLHQSEVTAVVAIFPPDSLDQSESGRVE
jgi:hypothetical protein